MRESRASEESRSVQITASLLDVPEQDLRHREDIGVCRVAADRQGAREAFSRVSQLPLRVPHDGRSDERLGFDRRPNSGYLRHLLEPLQRFRATSLNQPEEQEMPRNRRGFGCPLTLDQPSQNGAIALQIVSDAVQPFGLRWPDQSRSGA